MKYNKLLLLTLLVATLSSFKWGKENNENAFDHYFKTSTLRIDFELVGDAESETFILKQLKEEPQWAGSRRLINDVDLNMGNYRFCVYDSASQTLLYQYGFSSLFMEWQTTADAKINKASYMHVNHLPYPKHTIKYVLQKRAYATGLFTDIYQLYINPNNYFIIKEQSAKYPVSLISGNGKPENKIDIAFIAEGYTIGEMRKFKQDVKRVWEYIASVPPFNQHANKFNIYAVEASSLESGSDIPGEYIYKNTVLNSTFYTFDIDRYLTTPDLKAINDAAAGVPHDHLFVLVNSDKYGGGGFYNYYSATTADNPYSLKVAIHEFGHGLFGLADEYYSSEVAYSDFYHLEVEPWEPNITTLVDFDSKWKDMLTKDMPIPSPRVYNYRDSVGVYEGGGYLSKGIYSPYQDCRMKSNIPEGFCPVCSKAIEETIDFYTK